MSKRQWRQGSEDRWEKIAAQDRLPAGAMHLKIQPRARASWRRVPVSGAFTKALLLVLHEFVGLVSVDRPVAQVAGIGGCVSRTTGLPLANADLHIEHSLCVDAEPQWSKCLLLRLRGGKKEVKKKTKGKRIKQPRKLADIRKKEDDSKEEQESDFFSTSLSFEQLTAKGPQSSVGTRQASSASDATVLIEATV